MGLFTGKDYTAFAVVLFLSFVYNLLLLTSPLYILQLYQRVMNSQSVETLVLLTGVALSALLFAVILASVRRVLLQRLSHKTYVRLGERVITKSLGPALTIPSRAAPLEDVNIIRQFVGSNELLNMMDLPFTILFLFVLFLIHPYLGILGLVICTIMTMLAVASAYMFNKRQMIATKELRRSEEDFSRFASSGGLVYSLCMTGQVVRKWLVGQLAYSEDVRKAGRGGNITAGLSQAVRTSSQIIAMGTAALLALAGELNPGMILATSILLTRAISPIDGTITGHLKYKAARGAFARVSSLLSRPSRSTMFGRPPTTGEVRLSGVVYMPQGGTRKQPAVRGVDLVLTPGEVISVNGPSGAGKSLLAQLVIGSIDPTSGSVQLSGVELRNYPRDQLLGSIGYLPQISDALPGTIAENISLFQSNDSEAVWDAIRAVDMEAEVGALREGIDSPMSVARDLMAPGLYRRLLVARAIYGSPKLVVLDEPDLFLDHIGLKVLSGIVSDLRERNCAVLLISPRGAMSQQVSKRYIMNNGVLEPMDNNDKKKTSPTSPQRQNMTAGSPKGPAVQPQAPVGQQPKVSQATPQPRTFQKPGNDGSLRLIKED